MDFNKLRDEIHQNALDHGWWKEERSFGEIIALCHSELSEALEEHRNGRGVSEIYFKESSPVNCKECEKLICKKCKHFKPEGIPVELADTVIRILDYFGKEKAGFYNEYPAFITTKKISTFGDFIAVSHLYLSCAFDHNSLGPLKSLIMKIFEYCEKEHIDIESAINMKHEFNKTRPYRHGGKKL